MKENRKTKMMRTSAYVSPLMEVVEVNEENIICISGDSIGIGAPGFGGFGSDEAFNGNGVSTPGFGGFGSEVDF